MEKENKKLTRPNQTYKDKPMRDLVFKNLTSSQKGRKILCTYEAMEQGGVLTRIKRSFVYIVKSAQDAQKQMPLPHLHVLKMKDSRTHQEKFICRIKGSLYAMNDNKLFFIVFSHSLSIKLTPVTSGTNPVIN